MASGGGKRKLGQNKRKPTNVAYKAQDMASRNKKRRATRHAKRMERQTARVLDRYERGASLPSETIKRVRDKKKPYQNFEGFRRPSAEDSDIMLAARLLTAVEDEPEAGYVNQ
jgi:hypothetical protein